MSADNWAVCPKCERQKGLDIENLKQKIDENYGKVSQKEYTEMINQLEALQNSKPVYTLREDYEIGVYDGKFEVSYFGCCKTCGFELEFKHIEVIES